MPRWRASSRLQPSRGTVVPGAKERVGAVHSPTTIAPAWLTPWRPASVAGVRDGRLRTMRPRGSLIAVPRPERDGVNRHSLWGP